jgi:hypothetical protein
VGIERTFVDLFLKSSRVILMFKAVFFDLLRIRRVFGSIRWPVVIPKNLKIIYMIVEFLEIVEKLEKLIKIKHFQNQKDKII